MAWYQSLQLALGSTSISLGILLATYMGGLCIGSLWFPRLDFDDKHPLRVYSAIELAIAVLGVLITLAMPFIGHVYVFGAENGMPGLLLRAAIAAIAMLPSTILMGASLPAIVRWVNSTPALYGANTAGAVFGCLFAGFYLLRVFDMATAAYAAAAINVAVAAGSWLLAARAPVPPPAGPNTSPRLVDSEVSLWNIYAVAALSGACALGAEVIWTRLLGMLLLATVYVFSIILAVFLIGIAVGGAAAAPISRFIKPRIALGWSQVLLILGIVWTAFLITRILPFWQDSVLTTTSPWQMFLLDFKRCLWAILPPALLWGASFPLACAAAVRSADDDPSCVTGNIYAANTFGGIIGALAVSLFLIPGIGTQSSTRVILVLTAVSALLALRPRAILTGAGVLLAGALTFAIPETPGELIAYGRQMAGNTGQSTVLKVVEGRNSSVAITRWNNGAIYVNVNGHVEATTEIFDMKLQRMVGHLPGLLHPDPKSVLGIGFGAGVSAGTFTRYPGIRKITVCEIEPVVPPTSTEYFGKQDYNVYLNPKTTVIFDDARHFLLTTKEKYDIIASDPLDVFVKGTAALYSKEYFESVKSHLNPGGYFSLYVPLYETDEITIRSELETFFEAFPYATVWANTRDGLGYDMVFMGQLEPLKINLDDVAARLARPDYQLVLDSLREVGVRSSHELFSTYAGQRNDLGQWTKGSPVNRDADLKLSYLAGWGINAKLDDYLYRQILKYRKVSTNIFTGSTERLEALQSALAKQ